MSYLIAEKTCFYVLMYSGLLKLNSEVGYDAFQNKSDEKIKYNKPCNG